MRLHGGERRIVGFRRVHLAGSVRREEVCLDRRGGLESAFCVCAARSESFAEAQRESQRSDTDDFRGFAEYDTLRNVWTGSGKLASKC